MTIRLINDILTYCNIIMIQDTYVQAQTCVCTVVNITKLLKENHDYIASQECMN